MAVSTSSRRVACDDTDIIWGASEIAFVIGRTKRQTFHLLECGLLPARKVGNRWVASRIQLMTCLLGDGAPTERPRRRRLNELAPA